MNEITTLFTAIGDFFTGADWFQTVKFPFWVLLFTVAAGGVYCARFGKKTLLNQGISGFFGLTVIYLCAVMVYIHIPQVRTMFSELPFLSVSDQVVSLINPFTLTLTTLAPLLLRLMILIFLITLIDTFMVGGKTALSWLFSQLFSIFLALFCYAIITAGISLLIPAVLNRFAIIPVIAVVVIGILMLCAKFVFTVVFNGGNPYFSAVYKFFTVNKGGSLFTVSALTFLLALAVIIVLNAIGHSSLSYSTANTSALWIILGLLLLSMYIFSMFYIDRKKD